MAMRSVALHRFRFYAQLILIREKGTGYEMIMIHLGAHIQTLEKTQVVHVRTANSRSQSGKERASRKQDAVGYSDAKTDNSKSRVMDP